MENIVTIKKLNRFMFVNVIIVVYCSNFLKSL